MTVPQAVMAMGAGVGRERAEIGEIPVAGPAPRRCSSRVYASLGWRSTVSGRTIFDDPPLPHHRDIIADLRRHPQIMRDEQDGDAQPLLQFAEQRQHLRLHRDVERGDRLVRHQHIRLHGERARNRDALTLAAGEFDAESGLIAVGGQADQSISSRRLGERGLMRRAEIHRPLGDALADGHARIERAVGVLEHHLDALAVRAQRCARQAGNLLAAARGCRPMSARSAA